MHYINFYFRELEKKGDIVIGVFDDPDSEVFCRFEYNVVTREFHIWDTNKSEDEILPLPFYWLDMKLKENGELKKIESRICY